VALNIVGSLNNAILDPVSAPLQKSLSRDLANLQLFGNSSLGVIHAFLKPALPLL
jgi:hypothetical protein